jgi:hypothetical protein
LAKEKLQDVEGEDEEAAVDVERRYPLSCGQALEELEFFKVCGGSALLCDRDVVSDVAIKLPVMLAGMSLTVRLVVAICWLAVAIILFVDYLKLHCFVILRDVT